LNDDGTVTFRCDATAFFAHADVIRRLLTGDDEEAPAPAPARDAEHGGVTKLWSRVFSESHGSSRDLSRHNTEILAAGYYLTKLRGFEAFTRQQLADVYQALPSAARPQRPTKTPHLVHLARKGWLERVRRGSYRLSQRGQDRIESLRQLGPRPLPRPKPATQLPTLTGLSRFMREVPANRKWRRVLLVAYFLHEHCGVEEFDQRLIAACFQRLRGHDVPGSLPALISQVLHKRHGLVERGSRRGNYRLTSQALDELRRNPRVAEANATHRAARPDRVA
jgi:hypothetical protein